MDEQIKKIIILNKNKAVIFPPVHLRSPRYATTEYSNICKLQKGCTRHVSASGKVYQLPVHGQ
jgi:hypothetical protein